MAKFRRNFKSKLNLFCGSDPLRPALNHIEFVNGFAYASDAHVIIKQHLSLNDFSEEEIGFLNDNYIHKDTFAEIYKYDIVNVTPKGFICRKGNVTAKYDFKQFDFKMPNFEAVIIDSKEINQNTISKIGMNLKHLEKFKMGFIFNADKNIEMNFNASNRGILITALGIDESEQLGILMPVVL